MRLPLDTSRRRSGRESSGSCSNVVRSPPLNTERIPRAFERDDGRFRMGIIRGIEALEWMAHDPAAASLLRSFRNCPLKIRSDGRPVRRVNGSLRFGTFPPAQPRNANSTRKATTRRSQKPSQAIGFLSRSVVCSPRPGHAAAVVWFITVSSPLRRVS